VSSNKKKSLGRDPFEDEKEQRPAGTVEKLIKGRAQAPEAREVSVTVRLTPSNLKHLDGIRTELAARGKRGVSRNELIRIAISLLTADDIK